jgi:cytochrome c2
MRSLSSIAAFWLLSSATAIADDISVQRGGSLANKICSACHVVGADQEFSPILRNYGPDFREIAGRKDVSAGSLKTFLRTTHVRARIRHTRCQISSLQMNRWMLSWIIS